MVEFTFYLSANDTDRLFAIKQLQGKDNLTGNDFAAELLEAELQRLLKQLKKNIQKSRSYSLLNIKELKR